MAVGHLHDQVVTFISYYAPNTGQIVFFSMMLKILMLKAQGQVIMGGDRIMDKSDPMKLTLKRPPTGSSEIARLFHFHDLNDSWRENNPTA